MRRGLPLSCDATVVTPISGNGMPRGGTSNQNGRLLDIAQEDNDGNYAEVIASGLGCLLCLGCEVFGRWSSQCVPLVPDLARERTRGMHPRVRRGIALSLQHRWWGILFMSLQKTVARVVLRDEGEDLHEALLEPIPGTADLVVVP